MLAFRELLIEHTVKKVRIENLYKDKPLKVLIDGVVHDGVDSFSIEPAYSVDGRAVTLGIQTFVPVP